MKNIIDQVYQEGIEKSKLQGDEIIDKAKEEANTILQNAKDKKDKIIKDALSEAQQIRENIISELQLALQEAISNFSQQVANRLAQYHAKEPIKEAFSDIGFLREIMLAAIQKWNMESNEITLTWLIPEEKQSELENRLIEKSKDVLHKGIDIRVNRHTSLGFKIESRKDDYFISFTNSDFEQFFIQHLRQKTLELLSKNQKKKE